MLGLTLGRAALLHQRGVGNDLYHRHVVIEVGIRRDRSARRRICAVGELRWNVDLVLSAFLHPRQGFGKTRDHLVREERDRPLPGAAVEHLAAREATLVIDEDPILGLDRGARAGLDRDDLNGSLADRVSAKPGQCDSSGNYDQEADP